MKKQVNSSILTVGSMAFDSIRTPSGKADQVLGGSANYFSIAASLFTPINIVAVVGTDFPRKHLDWLQQRRIDTSGIRIADGKTFHWVGEYNENLNEAKTLSTALNVFEHFDPKLEPSHCESGYVFLANIDPVLQTQVLDQVKAPKLIAADSMNFWITGKPDELKQTLKRVDILSINEGEAYLLSGQKNLIKASELILDMGPAALIIKRGEYGAMLVTDSWTFMAPAYPVPEVADPTGAGDTFAGGFMGYLAHAGANREMMKNDPEQWSRLLRQAVITGCVMASFTVEDFSMHRIMRLEKHEFEARLRSFVSMVSLG